MTHSQLHATLITTLLCLGRGLGTSLLTGCGNGDTCSQCGPNGGSNSGGSSNGGSSNGGTSATGGTGAAPGGSGNTGAEVTAYCECMLNDCHDEYHSTWGEDHIAAEEQCHAEASLVPKNGSATQTGDFIECRLAACQRAAQDPSACAAALGGDVCAATP